jgi:hypothetical protein
MGDSGGKGSVASRCASAPRCSVQKYTETSAISGSSPVASPLNWRTRRQATGFSQLVTTQ